MRSLPVVPTLFGGGVCKSGLPLQLGTYGFAPWTMDGSIVWATPEDPPKVLIAKLRLWVSTAPVVPGLGDGEGEGST